MKKTDIAMLILIAAASAGIAYFIANSVFGGMTEKGVTVKTIAPITSQVDTPDPKIFNQNAINPSIAVKIGNTSSSTSAATP